ncbi:EAL domain-containing protein [Gimibacter soli]|uniref:EAL domain-containing protein n=1 Tax=Gimibacter soli TaxID=3024400 RepID=A0AAE9XW48_9PROT|nr:EAL domain-containing protein [Gimibacter soli]WCL54264.1 EAL domain-containing protein [Gimibacter soli]
MAVDPKALKQFTDFVANAVAHPDGRRAVHVRLSGLERHFRDSYFRRALAATLKPLLSRPGVLHQTMAGLGDIVFTVRGIDDVEIEAYLVKARKDLKDSDVIQGLNPAPGKSDMFVGWYNLDTDGATFKAQMDELVREELAIANPKPTGIAPKKISLVPVDRPDKQTVVKSLDPELFLALTKALHGADVSGLVRKQGIVAVMPGAPQTPVMVHRSIPFSVITETLLAGVKLQSDRWLAGYIEDFVTERLLASGPNMANEHSLASMVRVTSHAVNSKGFEMFERSLGGLSRAKVVLEFSARDAIERPAEFNKACDFARERGFRLALSDVGAEGLAWFQPGNVPVEFFKVRCPAGDVPGWWETPVKKAVAYLIDAVGKARVIMDGIDDKGDLEVATKQGVTLFQGKAVAPATI